MKSEIDEGEEVFRNRIGQYDLFQLLNTVTPIETDFSLNWQHQKLLVVFRVDLAL